MNETAMMTAGAGSMAQGNLVNIALAVAVGLMGVLVLRRALRREEPAEPVNDQLTYREVVEYFVNHRPSDERVKKAGLLRQQVGRQICVHWCYLDDEMNVCFDGNGKQMGRTTWVRMFDDELREMFGEHDLIVFE